MFTFILFQICLKDMLYTSKTLSLENANKSNKNIFLLTFDKYLS